MPHEVDHPFNLLHGMSAYEELVGHLMDEKYVPGVYLGREHPDACPDCAANPTVAEAVHRAERSVAASMVALRKFFVEEEPEPSLLLNMVMTAIITFNQSGGTINPS